MAEKSLLDPYLCQGVTFDSQSGEEHVGLCLFCGGSKFSVNEKKGMFRCLSCAVGNEKGGGNAEVFIEKLWESLDSRTSDYNSLAVDRGLMPDTIMEWGCCYSPYRNCWMIPGYNTAGKVRQLYRYVRAGGKKRPLGTTGLPHGIFGMSLYDPDKPTVYLCEGPWDGMALWETMKRGRWDENGMPRETASNRNMLSEANVIAIPGCTSFREQWCSLFSGKTVNLMFDNDLPALNKTTGALIPPGALLGLRRVVGLLTSYSKPPAVINYLHWGSGGESYYDPKLKSGFDVRDVLSQW